MLPPITAIPSPQEHVLHIASTFVNISSVTVYIVNYRNLWVPRETSSFSLLFKFWTFSSVSLFLNHNVSRKEPSLETLWFKNKETLEIVQNLKSSNTAPSSKTFRDEVPFPFRTLRISCVCRHSYLPTVKQAPVLSIIIVVFREPRYK
jgi:hypothetical protein